MPHEKIKVNYRWVNNIEILLFFQKKVKMISISKNC